MLYVGVLWRVAVLLHETVGAGVTDSAAIADSAAVAGTAGTYTLALVALT